MEEKSFEGAVPYGYPEDEKYLRSRIHDILQQQIDMGMYGKLFRGGTVLGGKKLEKEMLKERSIKELKKDAKDLGIKGYSRMSKRQLINSIAKKPIHDGEITSGYHPFIEKKRDLMKLVGGADEKEVRDLLHKMTVKELKKLAKKMKIRGYSNKNKSELVMMLAKYTK